MRKREVHERNTLAETGVFVNIKNFLSNNYFGISIILVFLWITLITSIILALLYIVILIASIYDE